MMRSERLRKKERNRLPKQRLIHGSKHMAVNAGVTTAIGGIGLYQTGTWDGALSYAAFGSAAGSIAAGATVKCFVLGTPVYIPADLNVVRLAAVATNGVIKGDSNWRAPAAAGAAALGVTGYAAAKISAARSQRTRRRNQKEEVDGIFRESDTLARSRRRALESRNLICLGGAKRDLSKVSTNSPRSWRSCSDLGGHDSHEP